MIFTEFVSRLHKPWYVYTMARSVAFPHGPDAEARTPLQRSGRTRMANAQREIDDLVLARAEQIQRERQDEVQCAAMSRGDAPVRCVHPLGHDPVEAPAWDKLWDHGAPGVYWMDR